MTFLHNAWYAFAWADDLTDTMFPRTVLGLPLVAYRKKNGLPAILHDRCPHRFAPLSMGKLIDDTIECGYHGLRFDCSGACSFNPHNEGQIPPKAVVRNFPAAERHRMIWVWMGQAGLADPANIPDFSCHTQPDLKMIHGEMTQEAHYQLIIDNLLDLSHINYLHAPYQEVHGLLSVKHEVVFEQGVLESRRTVPSTNAQKSFASFLANPDQPVEFWLNIKWFPPGACQLEVGVTPAGRPRSEGLSRIGTHIVTPESEGTTRYFYASCRNYALDDPKADDKIRWWQQVGFHEQDKPMIEAVQKNMQSSDLLSLKPILLSPDVAAVRARRILSQLIAEEMHAPKTVHLHDMTRDDKATSEI
ncbi:Rieske 2Fe-2S domain-containing protein [Paraburkholderia sp. NPDC080076]|uniref:Rieske 2Fe-2S domain-containing protein n=1 Tax=Paraburkholderia sp. NPDC080076 TaxID=3390605 RepID=UPI003D075E11